MGQYSFISDCDSTTGSETSTDCTGLTRQSTILLAITGLGQSSAIAAYQSQANRMKRSHDENGSIQMNMYSLGVMDLDLSISPDVFGLRAFDDTKPVTRMLPGSSPCELRLMDDRVGNDGFHDVIIENLSGTPTWRSSHVSPAEVTSLRRQWPASDVERLRPKLADKAFRYGGPGYCSVCDTRIYSAQDAHMIACHLELGQLWRFPVTWCAVWTGSGRACLQHLAEKHGGSMLEIKTNVGQFFPPWTVTRDVWHDALRSDVSEVAVDALLFHEAGSRLVHRYRVYKDPFPHPALCDGVIPRLLSCMCRAMAIVRLTHLRISIPSSGAPPGQVPVECFLEAVAPVAQSRPLPVSFTEEVTTLNTEESPELSPVSPPLILPVLEKIENDPPTTEVDEIRTTTPESGMPPPPGFPPFLFPENDGGMDADDICAQFSGPTTLTFPQIGRELSDISYETEIPEVVVPRPPSPDRTGCGSGSYGT